MLKNIDKTSFITVLIIPEEEEEEEEEDEKNADKVLLCLFNYNKSSLRQSASFTGGRRDFEESPWSDAISISCVFHYKIIRWPRKYKDKFR